MYNKFRLPITQRPINCHNSFFENSFCTSPEVFRVTKQNRNNLRPPIFLRFWGKPFRVMFSQNDVLQRRHHLEHLSVGGYLIKEGFQKFIMVFSGLQVAFWRGEDHVQGHQYPSANEVIRPHTT